MKTYKIGEDGLLKKIAPLQREIPFEVKKMYKTTHCKRCSKLIPLNRIYYDNKRCIECISYIEQVDEYFNKLINK